MTIIDVISLLVTIVIAVILVGGVIYLGLVLFRGYESLARRSLQRKYFGLEIHPDPHPGDVIVTYHTYHGLLAWFTQTPHQVALPPDDARKLLGRLLRFNLTWGLSSYGALFVPLLAILNYFAQLRSIGNQETVGGVMIVPSERDDTRIDEMPDG